jgi:DNA-binding transcriptional ArsR family regulator
VSVTINTASRAMLLKAACGHPLRLEILASYMDDGDGTWGILSPNDLAGLLEQPLGNVAYHVRILHDAKILRLSSTEQRRGALEHYYRLDRDRLRELRTVLKDHVALIERLASV